MNEWTGKQRGERSGRSLEMYQYCWVLWVELHVHVHVVGMCRTKTASFLWLSQGVIRTTVLLGSGILCVLFTPCLALLVL